MAVADTTIDAAPQFAPVSKNYGRYALTLLVAIYTVNFLDRQIINTIGESIKTDLKLTDTQIGALGGIFFAACYTILGIPIARLADKGNRSWVMAISLALWSGFTVLSGYAKNYAVLAFARAGVSIGEAGCSPTAHSLLADYFPKEKRATALAIYSMGISIGSLLGMALGGIVAERWGWRTAFLVAGLPGLFFAVAAIFTLREPRKQLTQDALKLSNAANHIPLRMVFTVLDKRPTFWLFALGGAFTAFVSYAHAQFFLPVFTRNHTPELIVFADQVKNVTGFSFGATGITSLSLGLAAGFGGAFGSWIGGVIADKWGAKDVRNFAMFPFLIPILTTPVLWYLFSIDNVGLAFLLLLAPNVAVAAWWGPVYGGVQSLVPPAMRAIAAAVLLFVINIIGLGYGPMTFGIVTDLMTTKNLADSGLDLASCATATKAAAEAAKAHLPAAADIAASVAKCGPASAAGIKTTVYLSTAIIPVAMLCFLLTRFTIKRDTENAQVTPPNPISIPRLSAYFFVGGALPGYALARASKMFFKPPPAHMDLWGLVIGGLIGIVIAVMIAKSHKAQPA